MAREGAAEAFNTFLVSQQPGVSCPIRRAVCDWLERGGAQIRGRGAKVLGNTVCNIGALHPEQVDVLQGRRRWVVIQPCGTTGDHCWRAHKGEGKHPAVFQAPLGLFPLEKGKSGKTQTKRECVCVQCGSVSWAVRCTTLLVPLHAGPLLG